MVFCFMLFVLYLTGIVETGIQLFGAGKVSSNCQQYVTNAKVTGNNLQALAWLQQNSICKCYFILSLQYLLTHESQASNGT